MSLTKFLELVGKLAWPLVVVAAFVLFIPEDAANQIGLHAIRTDYNGLWWLLLVLAGAAWLHAIFRWLDVRVLGEWQNTRKATQQRGAQREERLRSIKLRLDSLSAEEEGWIMYCLFHNQQTLNAPLETPIAHSLAQKGILVQGTGNVFSLPFTIPDDVWRYLLDHKADFLKSDMTESEERKTAELLAKFRASLYPNWQSR